MLKNLVLRQQHRMEAMTELDDKMQVGFSAGYKRVSTLRTIAAQVGQLEVGEQWMRGKCGNRPSIHQLEDDPEELSPLARKMLEFDPVDRFILRELCANLLHADQSERDAFIAWVHQQNPKLESGAAEAADERAIEPSVSEGS